uniref:RING-type domain-containing protein n=1 Tax=Globodera rostochiensis TaxID=31243 RepID=A0A914HAJ8_GLORO
MRDLKEEVGECAICLDEIDGDEMVRQLPACQHIFHTNCILAWFKQHITCPICRAKVFKTEDGKTEPVGVRQLPTLLQLIETEETLLLRLLRLLGLCKFTTNCHCCLLALLMLY